MKPYADSICATENGRVTLKSGFRWLKVPVPNISYWVGASGGCSQNIEKLSPRSQVQLKPSESNHLRYFLRRSRLPAPAGILAKHSLAI